MGSAAQLLLITIFARKLNVDVFASYLTAAAIIGVGEITSDFGTRIWAVRGFSLKSSHSRVLALALGTKLFYSAVSAVVILLLPFDALTTAQLVTCVLIAFTQPTSDPFIWHFRGKERIDIESALVLGWRLSVVGILAFLAWLGAGLSALLGCWLLANISRLAVESRQELSKSLLRGGGLPGHFRRKDIQDVIRAVFPIGSAFMLMNVFHRMGIFSLGFVGSSDDVAQYGAAFALVAGTGFLATSISISSFPGLSRAISEDNASSVEAIIRNKIKLISIVFVPLCAVGILLAPTALRLLYGDKYAISQMVMVLLLPGLYVSSVNFALKYSLNALSLNWADTASVTAGICVFMAILFSPLPLKLPELAALGWGLGELGIFLVKWSVLRAYTSYNGIRLYMPFILVLLLYFVAYSWWSFVF